MKAIVVGGGASGLMCASLLSESGVEVTLIEKNEKLGKKLFITGKGRCNVTNFCDTQTFLSNVVTNSKFTYSSISGFTPQDTIEFFERNSLKLKVERGNRVFPQSDKSSDVIKCFEKILAKYNVEVRLNTQVKEILTDNGTAVGVKINSGEKIFSDCVVVATGGISYSSTGSTGDGYKWAKELGHNVVEPRPALVPILLKEQYGLQGLSLKNVSASIVRDGKTLCEQFGEMLFTHNGVSGPIILSLSSLINRYYSNGKFEGKFYLVIDLKPALSIETLDSRLLREFSQKPNAEIKNVLPSLMPKALIDVVLQQSGIPVKTVVNSITKVQRERLSQVIKNLRFTVCGLEDINAGIITAGGVDCKQINPKNMMSKLVRNLYFIGEVLDVDALTGGFNLQLAFSAAHQTSASIIGDN
ncbi:MAG: NAD(P)/FAD-dependent oxidoreductase [Clostridia bacterium]|nr:NAD(P)/FAD-dependent oxidoreductase [Clostridia bacterium]MDE7328731.1 NAD(P)/FAD-dependent oxidoreductase [Clostridia bacterium]